MSESAIICFACGKPCTGEVLKVQERHFHINCFKCHECGTLLAAGGYFPRNDHYYCSKDYHRLYGTKCKTCGDFVEGRVITALGNSYHPKCFKCDRCKGEIRSGTVVTYNDKEEILCQNCTPDVSTSDTPPEYTSPPPASSDKSKSPSQTPPPSSSSQREQQRDQPIRNTGSSHSSHTSSVSVHSPKNRPLTGLSHLERKTTTISSSSAVSSPLITSTSSSSTTRSITTPILSPSMPSNVLSSFDDVFDFSKVPDINPETRPFMGKCAQCQESIRSAQSLIALNRHWHLFCFSCARCKRYLTNEYMDNGDQAYCEPCFQELYGLICETCQEYITGTVLEAGDRHFHPACAFCSKCSLKFGEGDDLCVSGEEVYHLDCERAKTSVTNRPSPNRNQEQITRIRPRSDNSAIIVENKASDASRGIIRPSTSRQNRITPDSQTPPVIYPLKELQLVGKVCLPKGVNRTRLEQHLADSEFFSAFGMDRNTYYSKPQWKQIELKKKANLF